MNNLDMVLAVGYRVTSSRAVHFRQWATSVLREYLVKGFVLDDRRLRDPRGTDYFDELLDRIRDIRASEKRFYQKVRDLRRQQCRLRRHVGRGQDLLRHHPAPRGTATACASRGRESCDRRPAHAS